MPRPQLPTVREDPSGEGTSSSTDPHQLPVDIIQKLHEKFFPLEKKSPPTPFFKDIFDLVANTCGVPTCKIDRAIDLLERAVARRPQTDAHEQGNSSAPPAIQEKSKKCHW